MIDPAAGDRGGRRRAGGEAYPRAAAAAAAMALAATPAFAGELPVGAPPLPASCNSANPYNLLFECLAEPFDAAVASASGDWNGARERLVRLGITPRGVYLANIQANPIGGRRQDWAYAHYAAASLAFDFGRIAGVDGLLLFAEGNWSAGRNLSAAHHLQDRVG